MAHINNITPQQISAIENTHLEQWTMCEARLDNIEAKLNEVINALNGWTLFIALNL